MSLELPDRASLDSTSTGLQADDLNGFFVHLLILHGLGECRLSGRLRESQSFSLFDRVARVCTSRIVCLETVSKEGCAGESRFRDEAWLISFKSQPGWFQHGTILAAAVLALTAVSCLVCQPNVTR